MRWLALGGALVGLAFLTKMLQAFLVLPALALVYLLCANTSWGKRIGHLLVAFGSMLLAGGWWIAIVELWPASSRPYIGGSQDNSILELTLGYNGLGRLSGNETGSVGGGGGGAGGGGWGATGITRLFNSEIGGQIAWLLPAALVLGVAALWFARRRVDVRAGVDPLGHLAPRDRADLQLHGRHLPRLLHRRPGPGGRRAGRDRRLGPLGAPQLPRRHRPDVVHRGAHLDVRVVPAGPVDRLPPLAEVGHRRPRHALRAGPRRCRAPAEEDRPRRRRGGPGRDPRRPRGVRRQHRGHAAHRLHPHSWSGHGRRPGRPRRRRCPGGLRGGAPTGTGQGTAPAAPTGGQTGTTGGQTATRGGGMGGLLNGSTPSAAVTKLLQTDADSYTWTAAAIGANNASGYQLASEQPVMAIGGFNGSDPSPTLAQFKQYVAERPDPLLHRQQRRRRRRRGRHGQQQRDHRLGGGQLHGDHGRQHHALRPLGRDQVSSMVQPAPEEGGSTEVATRTVLDVVIPVFNEEAQLADSVERVLDHLHAMPWSFRVTIADNASTDQTALIARRLSHTHPEVTVVHLAEKGRGRALKRVWSASESDVLVYMDVDLSTDLAALLPLVAPLVSGHSDLAIGSRLSRASRVERGAKRELISRSYNLILRRALRARFSDAQCGFKAIRRSAARELLPLVEDNAWFFDTELLVVAERAGLRIHEVPVDWTDDPESSVDIVRTAIDDLKGVARLGRSLVRGTLPLREIGERLGRTSSEAGRGRLGMQVGHLPGDRHRLDAGLRAALPGPAVDHVALVGQLHRAAGHGGREHRGQPAVHLRGEGPRRRRASPGAGAGHLRRRARGHDRAR